MSADLLREAAALMRARAGAATQAVWSTDMDVVTGMPFVCTDAGLYLFGHFREAPPGKPDPDAEHSASWHPAVALAVADWLDHAAESADLNRTPYVEDHYQHALKVAAAYLGRPTP